MSRSLAALIFLLPVCYAGVQPATSAPVRHPSDALVLRPQCYGLSMDDLARRMGRLGGDEDVLHDAEAELSYGYSGGLGAVGSGYGAGGLANSAPMPSAAPVAEPTMRPRDAGAVAAKPSAAKKDSASDKSSREESRARPVSESLSFAQPSPAGAPTSMIDVDRRLQPPQQPVATPQAPSLDFGATTWLSNDDSMSLASAQHVLWQTMNGQRPSLAHVRPHELLNYFSFDTEKPVRETFGVTASARQTGPDAMTLALAVQGASPARAPLDLSFLVDRSGSMSAEGRMDYTRRALNLAVDNLHAGDRVDLVLFDGTACTPVENFVVGRDDSAYLSAMLDLMAPRGSTNLDAGLKAAFDAQRNKKDTAGRARRVMVLTDAGLNTGNVNQHVVSEVARAYEADGIRLTGVGVGRGFNDEMLNMLTEKGKGAYVYLGSEAVVDRLFGQGFDSLVQTIAHDVRFGLKLPSSLAIERFYGEESSTVEADVQPIHYYAGTSQLFLQDLKVAPGGTKSKDPVQFIVKWTDPTNGSAKERTFHTTVGELVEGPSRNVDKGLALMAWTDLLMADALGGDACGAPAGLWNERAGLVADDAEISFVDGLVKRRCPGAPALVATSAPKATVAVKVRVDADQPIAEVALACTSGTQRSALTASTSIARFDVAPGACKITLQGTVPMVASVRVSEAGSDVRCVVRAGRFDCQG